MVDAGNATTPVPFNEVKVSTTPLPYSQAHSNAQSHSDEFVAEHMASLGKLGSVVHQLLVIEVVQRCCGGRCCLHAYMFVFMDYAEALPA